MPRTTSAFIINHKTGRGKNVALLRYDKTRALFVQRSIHKTVLIQFLELRAADQRVSLPSPALSVSFYLFALFLSLMRHNLYSTEVAGWMTLHKADGWRIGRLSAKRSS